MVRTTTNCIGVWVSQVLYWVSWLCHPSKEGLTVAMFEQMSDPSANAVSVIPVHIRTKDKTSSTKED